MSESWLNQEYSRGFDSVQDTFEDDSTRIEFIDEVLDKQETFPSSCGINSLRQVLFSDSFCRSGGVTPSNSLKTHTCCLWVLHIEVFDNHHGVASTVSVV